MGDAAKKKLLITITYHTCTQNTKWHDIDKVIITINHCPWLDKDGSAIWNTSSNRRGRSRKLDEIKVEEQCLLQTT
jgi:hypothetical protein